MRLTGAYSSRSRAFSGTAGNGSWNNVYFTAGLEDSVSNGAHALDAFYGSWNANGQGQSITHQRLQVIAPPQQVFDNTFDSRDTVASDGTSSPSDISYQFTLASGGAVFLATGTQGLYSLTVGLAAPQHSGSGVFVNPLSVVNGANYAPGDFTEWRSGECERRGGFAVLRESEPDYVPGAARYYAG